MIYLDTKSDIHSFNGFLLIVVKVKAKWKFWAVAMLFYIIQKLPKNSCFFEHLLPHMIWGLYIVSLLPDKLVPPPCCYYWQYENRSICSKAAKGKTQKTEPSCDTLTLSPPRKKSLLNMPVTCSPPKHNTTAVKKRKIIILLHMYRAYSHMNVIPLAVIRWRSLGHSPQAE
jgi:hypothetical protein